MHAPSYVMFLFVWAARGSSVSGPNLEGSLDTPPPGWEMTGMSFITARYHGRKLGECKGSGLSHYACSARTNAEDCWDLAGIGCEWHDPLPFIIGGSVGGVLFICIIICSVYCCWKRGCCGNPQRAPAMPPQHQGVPMQQQVQAMQPQVAVPVSNVPMGSKFDPNTGAPIPKFDPNTGVQNY